MFRSAASSDSPASSYVAPIVDLSSVPASTAPISLVKKKTRKAFVPGYGAVKSDFDGRSVCSSADNGVGQVPQPVPRFINVPSQEPSTTSSPPEGVSAVVSRVESIDEAVTPEVMNELVEPMPETAETEPPHIEVQIHPTDAAQEDAVNVADEETVRGESSHLSEESTIQADLTKVPDQDTSPDSHSEDVKALMHQQSELRKTHVSLKSRLADLVTRQDALCEEEKFEEAEALDSELRTVRDELHRINSELSISLPARLAAARAAASAQLDVLLRMKVEHLTALRDASSVEQTRFEATKKALQHRLAVAVKVDEQFAEQENDVGALREALVARQTELESRIEAESQNLISDKKSAELEYAQVDKLIGDLQTQLAEAMAKRSECAMRLSGAEMRLTSVRAQYVDELEDVEVQSAQVEAAVRALTEAKEAMGGGDKAAIEKELADLNIDAEDSQGSSMLEIAGLEADVRDFEALISAQSKWDSEFAVMVEAVSVIREQAIEASEETQMLLESLTDAEKQVDTFRAKVAEMKIRLPELEENKRVAVASRAYKDAKELTAEIKDIADQVDGAEAKLTELRASAKSARVVLQSATKTEEELAVQRDAAELGFAVKETEWLKSKVTDIQRLIGEVTNAKVLATLREELSIAESQLGDNVRAPIEVTPHEGGNVSE